MTGSCALAAGSGKKNDDNCGKPETHDSTSDRSGTLRFSYENATATSFATIMAVIGMVHAQ
jgi:hypothetical protein